MNKKYVTLKDVCDKASSSIAQKDLVGNDGSYPIYGASGFIKNVDFYKQEKEYIAIVKDGAGIGRAMKLPAYSSVIGTMQYIIPRENINISYLYYAICAMHLEKYFSGATIPHIYFKDYQKEKIYLPSLPEQEKIASIFEKLEWLIANKKKQLEHLDLLVQSRFIEMFGDPVCNSKNLELRTLSELGELGRGVSKHRPRNDPILLNGPYPLIQTGDVGSADLFIRQYKATYSEKGLQQSRMWPAGTLCITIAANIAQTGILTFKSCFPDSVVGFIPGKSIRNIYLYYWFTFLQSIIEMNATQVAQKNINLQILGGLQVLVPDLCLQDEFVDFVKNIDKSKLAIQKSLDELETLKKSLMQEYFG